MNEIVNKAAYYARIAQYASDGFSQVYLGAKDVAPTTDNNGNPLIVGALYFNTTNDTMYAWDGSAWDAITFNENTPFLSTGSTTARTLENRFADVVNVKDFGAVGDGVADDTAAIQAAVNATPINGTIFIPDGNYLISSNINSSSKAFILYGTFTGSGIIVGENSFFDYQGLPYSISSSFGSGFLAPLQIFSNSNNIHNDTRSSLGVVRKTFGSGTNGPSRADTATFFCVEKDNWLTTTQDGEIDGQYIVCKQGSKADVGGILIDIEKVKLGTGGSVGVEIANKWVNSSQTRLMAIQTINNFLEGNGGHSGNTGYGFYAEAQAGNPFAAFYAGGSNDGGPNSPGGFQNLIVYYSDRLSNGGILIYKIDALGRTYAPFGTAASPAYSFNGDEDTGIYRLSTDAFGFSTGGQIRWLIDSAGHFWPGSDNSYSVGTPSNRASVIYAATGTINTSDEREKTFLNIEDSEKLAALEIKSNLRKFKFNSAIEEKGENARIHFGASAQQVGDIMKSHGLDPNKYGFYCYDEWDEIQETKDEKGNVMQEYRPAGNRYGLRYEELLAFIISAI